MTPGLISLITASLLGQAGGNLDFGKGSLAGWDGAGFSFVAATETRPAGAWSKDGASPTRKGMVRFIVTIPADARLLTFQAFADVVGDHEPDQRFNVVRAGADNVPVPRQIKTNEGGWEPSPRILLSRLGKPRHYAWDVSLHQGKRVQIVLIDQDDRPGHELFAGGFQFVGSLAAVVSLIHDAEFGPHMVALEKKYNLAPMAKFDSKRFTAVSNASENFTTERLQNCEVFYDLFLKHFEQKGFKVHPPIQRLMIAVFDTHEGFDAYFGQKMPSGIAGVYHTPSNRLVLYDYAENRGLIASKNAALKKGDAIANSSKKSKYVGTIERQLNDFSKDANLSTTMHECAHQISFNCGLLNRKGDVPASIAEGLATYCESTDQGDWTSLGAINPMRITDLHRARGSFIALTDLIQNEKWLSTSRVLTGYAQSWALFHLLMHEQPRQLQKYLKLIESRRTPESRLADFQEAFGNLSRFEQRYQSYLNDLMAKHKPAVMR